MYHFIIFRMSTVEQTIHISVSYTRLGEAFALQEISTPPPPKMAVFSVYQVYKHPIQLKHLFLKVTDYFNWGLRFVDLVVISTKRRWS